MPDFTSQLSAQTPLLGFHSGLVALYDFLLGSDKVSEETKPVLARLRAQADIALKNI